MNRRLYFSSLISKPSNWRLCKTDISYWSGFTVSSCSKHYSKTWYRFWNSLSPGDGQISLIKHKITIRTVSHMNKIYLLITFLFLATGFFLCWKREGTSKRFLEYICTRAIEKCMLQFYFIRNQAMYKYGFQGITYKSSSKYMVFSVLFLVAQKEHKIWNKSWPDYFILGILQFYTRHWKYQSSKAVSYNRRANYSWVLTSDDTQNSTDYDFINKN